MKWVSEGKINFPGHLFPLIGGGEGGSDLIACASYNYYSIYLGYLSF